MSNTIDLQVRDKSVQELGSQFVTKMMEAPPGRDDAVLVATIHRVRPQTIRGADGREYAIGGDYVNVLLSGPRFASPGAEFPCGLRRTFPAGTVEAAMPMAVAFAYFECWRLKLGARACMEGSPAEVTKIWFVGGPGAPMS